MAEMPHAATAGRVDQERRLQDVSSRPGAAELRHGQYGSLKRVACLASV